MKKTLRLRFVAMGALLTATGLGSAAEPFPTGASRFSQQPAWLSAQASDWAAEQRLEAPLPLPTLAAEIGSSAAVTNVAYQEPAQLPPPVVCAPADDVCCPPVWCHRSGVYLDLLYLHAGNVDYVYAVEKTGTLPADAPTGPVGRVGFDGALGYRLGYNHALTDCSSIQTSYTWFQDETNDTINANPGNVLVFQPGHPSLPNVANSSIQATANYDIRFQQVDIDYRSLLWGTDTGAVNFFAGLRYANLKQTLAAQEDVGVPAGLSTVNTNINFDGFGIGFGIDGLRRSNCTGLLIYSRASASFLSGEFNADYLQTAQFIPGVAAGNDIEEFRTITILQAELGTGWQSLDGRYMITAGYQFAGWYNCLTTGTYISGVQAGRFDDMTETISFSGLVSRFQYSF